MAKGFFDDVTVKIVTIETGSGHTNAVLSGQAFAFIGGPEHNAFAKAKGAELRAVVNCVDRGNVYFCAAKGRSRTTPTGRAISRARPSRSAPSAARPTRSPAICSQMEARCQERRDADRNRQFRDHRVVRSRQAQIGEATEPFVTQGVRNKVWGEPFFNVPKRLGPYAYSTLNVRLDSIQKEPELVRAFVRGMMKGAEVHLRRTAEAARIAKAQFPTMPLDDLQATLDRSFADEMWSRDGTSAAGVGHRQRRGGRGRLKADIKYDEIIDMSFVDRLKARL